LGISFPIIMELLSDPRLYKYSTNGLRIIRKDYNPIVLLGDLLSIYWMYNIVTSYGLPEYVLLGV
jgi:hypothetical protein